MPTARRIHNALQTNGTLLDDEWCGFLAAENFLVGLSIDGPRPLHDAYRVDKQQQPTFDAVMRGLDFLAEASRRVQHAHRGQPQELNGSRWRSIAFSSRSARRSCSSSRWWSERQTCS